MRLIDEVLAGESLGQAFFLEGELERVKIAIVGVRGVQDRFRAVLKARFSPSFSECLVLTKIPVRSRD